MSQEQDKTLSALQYAIQMEIDGKEYYLKASGQSGNEMGKKLLKSLAAEEDIHRKKFDQIYEALRAKKAWPEVGYHTDGGKSLRTIFAQENRKTGTGTKGSRSELDAVQGAIRMEVKSYDYYVAQGGKATLAAEKNFYTALSAQERQHQLLLLDYFEYLKNPAAYFVKTEHPNIDAG